MVHSIHLKFGLQNPYVLIIPILFLKLWKIITDKINVMDALTNFLNF